MASSRSTIGILSSPAVDRYSWAAIPWLFRPLTALMVLLGGLAMIVTMLGNLFTLKTATDFQSFGIGFAAWSGGLGAYIAAGAGALWMQAAADAVPPPKKQVVTETVDNPPNKPVTKTTVIETPPKDEG